MFKKRVPKGSSRKSIRDDSEADDAEEYAIIQDLKEQQQWRKKVKVRDNSVEKLKVEDVAVAEHSIESMMGSQFSVRSENGTADFLAHQRIMEEFIQSKLGISNTDKR